MPDSNGPRRDPDFINFPPFETEDLRANLTRFLDTSFEEAVGQTR
ncbi:MAG: GIY-YIG nuclease family protein, partial [Alphaproteobacteria bacterium]|nr:GIY-YIG nuclease family protein [Alphaproteobacteria bacterium]